MKIEVKIEIDDSLVKYFIENNFGGEKFDDVLHLISARASIEFKKSIMIAFIDKCKEGGLRFPTEDEIDNLGKN